MRLANLTSAALCAALWAALGLVASCSPPASPGADLGVRLELGPEPLAVGTAQAVVHLTDPVGEPLTGATVELEGNMNHAGMVPVFADAVETEPGTYAAPLEFTMGGDWFVLVRADLPDGGKLERAIDVPGVAAEAGEPAGEPAATEPCCEAEEADCCAVPEQ